MASSSRAAHRPRRHGRHAFSTVVPPGDYTCGSRASIHSGGAAASNGRLRRRSRAVPETAHERSDPRAGAGGGERSAAADHRSRRRDAPRRVSRSASVRSPATGRRGGPHRNRRCRGRRSAPSGTSRIISKDGAWGIVRIEIPLADSSPGRFVAARAIVARARARSDKSAARSRTTRS